MLNQQQPLNVIVTGGAGFIGSNFLRRLMNRYPQHDYTNVDSLTYAGNPASIKDLAERGNYHFVKADITDFEKMRKVVSPDSLVVNFAAESHVDNSILDAFVFVRTNVLGTCSLLEAARQNRARLFVQISTDEVYGSLGFDSPSSKEGDVPRPSSAYSASKTAAEHFCFANVRTHKQSIIVTRSSNNFGPYAFPEKVIPLFVTNLLRKQKVPLYGTGKNIRDWIFVEDNCAAIEHVIEHGTPGEVYNIAGGNEISNLELTHRILKAMGLDESFIQPVEDRKGHDLRYSLDDSKLRNLGWKPTQGFDEALKKTIDWYVNNTLWWKPLKRMKGRRTS
jgi:dTDP-glucose 4,6-dehydratase